MTAAPSSSTRTPVEIVRDGFERLLNQRAADQQIGMLPKHQSPADKAMTAAFNLKTRIARGLRR